MVQILARSGVGFVKKSSPNPWISLLQSFAPLRVCETLWSAREIALAALLAEQKRHTENVFHMLVRRVHHYIPCQKWDSESFFNTSCWDKNMNEINYSKGAENIDFTY